MRGMYRLTCACLLTVSAVIAEGQETINLAKPPAGLDTSEMPIEVVDAYPNLRIERPIVVTGAGDGSGRLFIATQQGKIFSINEADQNVSKPTLFMNLQASVVYKDRENEEGFLGLTFHPRFRQNGYFYVYYTTKDEPQTSVISRFQVAKESGQGDPASEVELMRIKQPFWNHNGGTLIFGPDGFLYIALGDGGKANDPLNSGQDPGQLLGSILRIDVDKSSDGKQYSIPKDNPFVGKQNARPEVFAIGIRNVWRMAFDQKTGLLWAADVGQNEWEEINLIQRGGNYGWSLREAAHSFTLGGGPGSGPRADLIDPIVEYPHTDAWGKSITGGAVYRGTKTPILNGYYLYGDYISGFLWALKYDHEKKVVTENRAIKWNNLPIFTFGQTDTGEVLMTTQTAGGRIYRFAER